MTCIVSIVKDGVVYMGGDSAGVSGLSITIRADEKVFHNNQFIIGFTSSFRMGQLLRYKFIPPKQKLKQSDMEYMVTDFVDSLRKTFKDNGFGKIQDSSDNVGGNFLIGYKSKLYNLQSDFQVGVPSLTYDAVGCGANIALGSLYSSKDKDPIERINLALEAAATFNAGVVAPFHIVKLEPPASKKRAK